MAKVAGSGATVSRGQQTPALEVRKAGQALGGDEDNIAAATAITAVRPAPGNVLIASKCHGSGSSGARAHTDPDLVQEQRGPALYAGFAVVALPALPAGSVSVELGDELPVATGMILTRFRSTPKSTNVTVPSARANKV